jgi:hypothetical protein
MGTAAAVSLFAHCDSRVVSRGLLSQALLGLGSSHPGSILITPELRVFETRSDPPAFSLLVRVSTTSISSYPVMMYYKTD